MTIFVGMALKNFDNYLYPIAEMNINIWRIKSGKYLNH